MQTVIAIIALIFLAILLIFIGYAIGRASAKKNAGVDPGTSAVPSDGDAW